MHKTKNLNILNSDKIKILYIKDYGRIWSHKKVLLNKLVVFLMFLGSSLDTLGAILDRIACTELQKSPFYVSLRSWGKNWDGLFNVFLTNGFCFLKAVL